ncbi:TPM domain-containing protein [Arvimicrobium flavum]|uniref:TPM domain-containing protein n=1 Tax=Arvimicrobium flavum TaxID=3393320 RepID=UPI00398CB813
MTAAEHRRVTAAIQAAESRTSGEIYCVVARASDNYFFPAASIALASILVFSLPVALALEYRWIALRLLWFVGAQLLAAACALLALWLVPALRLALVPHRLRYRRAHDNARKQFLARNVHVTTARTGVLIFVSLAERYAEVVADSGINQKVSQVTWNAIVAELVAAAKADRLADGFVKAVETVGALLSAHFPVSPDDANELDDRVVEI